MMETFIGRGHSFVDRIEDCDVVLFDLHTRIANYKQNDIDWVCQNRPKLATFDEWDRGNLSEDLWPYPLTGQQKDVFYHSYEAGGRQINFCRLLDKNISYSVKIFPYEKPILYEEPLLSKDDLFNREFDIAYIANSAPSRDSIANALIEDGRLKCYISIGEKKIPFEEFVKQHKRAKFFISSAAGGYTDERCQCLFSVAAIIRQRTDQWLLHDFTHLDNCLRIDAPPIKEDLDTIVEIVNDKDRLYEIYLSGYNFMKTYYSKEYIAGNILETIEKHLS
jgi:hypothetical protein